MAHGLAEDLADPHGALHTNDQWLLYGQLDGEHPGALPHCCYAVPMTMDVDVAGQIATWGSGRPITSATGTCPF